MKRYLFFILLFSVYQLNAQNTCESQRYKDEVFTNYDVINGVHFASVDPYGLLTNQDLKLDVYMPQGDTLTKRPVIVHQFGGAYLIGWRSQPNIPAFAAEYTKRGYVFISLDYRLNFNALDPNSPLRAVYRGFQDLRAGLRYIKDSAMVYGIDTNHIFLTGTSAGSINAMGQSFMNESDRPSSTYGTTLEPADLGCVNCAGNTNNNNQEVRVHGIINNWGAMLDTSYIDLATDPADNVPVISFHGDQDNAVPYVEGVPFSYPLFPSVQGTYLIHQRLENQGIKNEIHALVGKGHEPQLLDPNVTDTIIKYTIPFLYDIMKGEANTIIGDTTVCLNDEVQYTTAQVLGSVYCWEAIGGQIIQQNNNQVSVKWNQIGVHRLVLTEKNDIDLSKKDTIYIEVKTPTSVNINYSSANGLFQFASNTINNATYHWSFGDSHTATGQYTNHQYTDTGMYQVVLNVNDNYCEATDTVKIVSDICPIANFTTTISDSNLLLNNTAQFYTQVEWDFGDGTQHTGLVNSHQYQAEGTYTIQQIVSNAFCSDTIEKVVEINFCALADFDVNNNGLQVQIQNNSTNNIANFWNFGDGTTNGTATPQHTYAQAGTYTIELIAYNANLCSDTMQKTIVVEEIADSTQTAINDLLADEIVIYPNPANAYIFIENKSNKNTLLQIYNAVGQKIEQVEVAKGSKTKLDVLQYSKGVYWIGLSNQKAYKIKYFIR